MNEANKTDRVNKAPTRERSVHRAYPVHPLRCVPVILLASTCLAAPRSWSKSAPNELTNPGFETNAAWVPQGPAASASFDTTVRRSGARSARCTAVTPVNQGGFLQEFELNQTQALPLLVTGWSRAENVSGPRNNHYSVWCDVKYARQLRPGRIDKAAIAPFAVGTHDWEQAQVLLIPERPIKTVKLYALFRRHTGTVWFDDFALRQLPPFTPPDLPKPAGPLHSLPAEGAFRLGLSPLGAVGSVTANGVACPARRWCGLFVGDYNRRAFWPVTGKTTFTANGATLTAALPEAGLEVTATVTTREDGVEFSGWVRDLAGKDRAIDVCLTLPVGGAEWRWEDEIDDATRRTRDVDAKATAPESTEAFPLVCVTRQQAGIAVGIPPDFPCMFRLERSANHGLQARIRLGLTAAAGAPLRSRAPFRFTVFAADPRWGYRDALRRYYALYPKPFQRRAKAEGLWLFAFPPTKLPNPQHYAYWEGGPTGAKEAAKLGIGCYPYRIPVQRSILHLPRLPATYEEAMAALAAYAPQGTGFGGKGTKEQIENAGIRDAAGRYSIVIRNDVGADVKPKNPINMVVFCVNCNPNLLADSAALTPAKQVLADVRRMLKQYPEIAGIYLDSMTGWSGRKLNFRRDHFRYETIPLTYDELTGRVAIHGKFDGVQFLEALGKLLHPTGRLVFQNLNHATNNVYHWFSGDVCGCEGAFRGFSERTYNYFRAAAGQKPVLLLDYATVIGHSTGLDTRPGVTKYFTYAAAYGFYPALGRYCDKAYADYRDLYDTFIPAIQKLSAAGWRPVTGAVTETAGVRLERFGPREGRVYLTVFNPGDIPRRAVVRWRPETFGWKTVKTVASALTGRSLEAGAAFRVDLPPLGLEIVEARGE